MKLNRSWLMAMCVVGMGALFILPALGIGLGSLFGLLIILLCPLSHILMMRGFAGKGGGCHGAETGPPPGPNARSLPMEAKPSAAVEDATAPRA